jgi:hypothetical protein
VLKSRAVALNEAEAGPTAVCSDIEPLARCRFDAATFDIEISTVYSSRVTLRQVGQLLCIPR